MAVLTDFILTISWDSPSDPNGIVSYEINITFHDLATGVMALREGPIQRNASNRFVQFSLSAEPFVRYDVFLFARTIRGVSEIVSTNVTTDEGGKKLNLLY